MVLVLLLIGRERGARCFNQSQTAAMQNQSNCEITFDTQLKSALIEQAPGHNQRYFRRDSVPFSNQWFHEHSYISYTDYNLSLSSAHKKKYCC